MASNLIPPSPARAPSGPEVHPPGPDDLVVVTGGAGFIGRHLVRALQAAGARVRVLDALVASVHGPEPVWPSELGGCERIRADVRDPAALEQALEGCTLLYHLAAETGTGESMYRAHRYVDVNVGGTALLCDALGRAASRPRRAVLASSRAVYGEGPWADAHGTRHPGTRTEADLARGRWDPVAPDGTPLVPLPMGPGCALAPSSVYGETKRAQEELFRLVLPPLGVEPWVLRLQNVYGPGQSTRNPYTGILSIFSVLLLEGDEVRVFEDGLESRDFVFVDDVVAALLAAAAAPGAPVPVDVGTGRRVSVLEVARTLATLLERGEEAVRVTGEYRLGDIRHASADPGVLAARLGVVPSVSFEEGVRRLVEWIRATERPRSRLADALAEMSAHGLLGSAGDRP
ncbi:MAG: NAD-dependent epimerase/dehydratase family protein [Gemmatimonadetes bacterium]|nr:NAD-dependent epimerase/dehydratase family protein [Gemmatimonadota bacterium]